MVKKKKITYLPTQRHRRPEFHPWVGKIPGGGNGNPLRYSCLENPMDRGACGVTKSRTQLKVTSVQFSRSVVSDSLQPHEPQHARSPCPSPTPGVHSNPMSIESVMQSNHLILCRSLLLPPSIFPSIRVFSNESALHIRWPKYWSFSFNISPSKEHPGLVSFRVDWLDLLPVQGTFETLLQYHN